MKVADLLLEVGALGEAQHSTAARTATRTLRGRLLEPGQVQLADIGALRIDETAKTVELVPTNFAGAGAEALTAAALAARLAATPGIGGFALHGVDRRVELPNGGQLLKSQPVLGVLRHDADTALWLLLEPESQWPAEWFGG